MQNIHLVPNLLGQVADTFLSDVENIEFAIETIGVFF